MNPTTAPQPDSPAWLRLPLWVHGLVVALVAASLSLIFRQEAPDTLRYLSEARNLATLGMFSLDGLTPTVRDVPGFPFLLALLLKAGIEDPGVPVRLLNGICLGLTALAGARFALLLLGREERGRLGAVATLYLIGFCPTQLGTCLYALSEPAYTVLWMWSNVLAAEAVFQPSPANRRRWATAGLLLGLACLFRPIPLLFPLLLLPAALAVAWHRRPEPAATPGAARSGALGNAVLFLLFLLLVTAPWAWRNYTVVHRFYPLGFGSGMHLSIGASQEWRGEYPDWEPVDALIQEGYALETADRELGKRAVRTIADAPVPWLRLLPLKWYRLFLGVPGSKRQIHSAWIVNGLFAVNLLLLGVCLAGLLRFRQRLLCWWLLLPVAYTTVTHSILFAMPRFRVPIEPYLLVLGACGLVLALPWKTRTRIREP